MNLKESFYKTYRLIIGSIAFYPTIIAVVFFIVAMLMMAFEYQGFAGDIKSRISFLLVNSQEDARLILGTLVGSIISLMVFSFSMVMLVLNRATATLSPRVIPGLITDKSNQVVLGCYLGSIIYCLVLIINIQSIDDTNGIPSLGILAAMIFGITCLGFFIYFIHTISISIQVDNILDRILKQTMTEMDKSELNPGDDNIEFPSTESWQTLTAPESGYLKQVQTKRLINLCNAHDLCLKLINPIGFFHVQGIPYLHVNKSVSAELEESIHSMFVFYPEEHLEDHYRFGINQISEIAVKALSPGINDPGTAIKGIDMLSILLIKNMNMREKLAIRDNDGKTHLYFAQVKFSELLYNTFTPIRAYGKTDAVVMFNLLEGIKNMIYADQASLNLTTLTNYANSILDSCSSINNIMDMEKIDTMVEAINELVSTELSLKTLSKR